MVPGAADKMADVVQIGRGFQELSRSGSKLMRRLQNFKKPVCEAGNVARVF